MNGALESCGADKDATPINRRLSLSKGFPVRHLLLLQRFSCSMCDFIKEYVT